MAQKNPRNRRHSQSKSTLPQTDYQAAFNRSDQLIRLDYTNGGDIVLGNNGNNQLVGGSSDDILDGGAGNDQYIGNAGQDTFVVSVDQGTDTIVNYERGVDVMGLANGLTFSDLSIVQQGSDSLIRANGETSTVVQGVHASQLGEDDFTSVRHTRFEGLLLPVSPQDLVHMD